MALILALLAAIVMATIGCLFVRGASNALVPNTFALRLPPRVDRKLTLANVYGKMPPRLCLSRKYRLRSGQKVHSLIYEINLGDPEDADGFPWRAGYRNDDGTKHHVWVNDYGQWSSNPWSKSDLDLIEITE